MSRILRKVYLWIVVVFWSRRYSLTSIIASSLSLQAFACTYGTPDDSNSGPFQDLTPTGCQPVFELQTNTDAKAEVAYSSSEQKIVDQLTLAEKAKKKIKAADHKTAFLAWIKKGRNPVGLLPFFAFSTAVLRLCRTPVRRRVRKATLLPLFFEPLPAGL